MTGNRQVEALMLVGAAFLTACHIADRTLAPSVVKVAPSSEQQTNSVLGTFSLPIPSTNEVGNAPVSTGIFVPAGVQATVTVTGYLNYSLNPGREACSPTPPSTPPGGYNPVGPIGFLPTIGYAYTGHGAVISVQQADQFDPFATAVEFQPNDPGAETVSGVVTGPAYLWFNRRPGFPGSCGTPEGGSVPDHLVSGSQMLSVETVPEPTSIEVVCAGTGALRGSGISCEARPHPVGDLLVVSGWTFIGVDGDTVIRTVDPTSPSWAGQLVLDGWIQVTGTVGGVNAMGSASVTVSARDWSGKTVRSNHATPGPDILPARPDSFGDLGRSSLALSVRQDGSNYLATVSDGGPNSGFLYMIDIPFETFTVARVNYPPMLEGSDWYVIQYQKDSRRGGIDYCGRPRVLTLPPLVEAHEGIDWPNQPDSHVGIFINDVTRDSRVKSERLAGPSARLNPDSVRSEIEMAAYADSKAMDTSSVRNNIQLPCVFIYDYSRLP